MLRKSSTQKNFNSRTNLDPPFTSPKSSRLHIKNNPSQQHTNSPIHQYYHAGSELTYLTERVSMLEDSLQQEKKSRLRDYQMVIDRMRNVRCKHQLLLMPSNQQEDPE